MDDLVREQTLHPDAARVFRVKKDLADTGASSPIVFHKHQRDAIETAATRKSYVLDGHRLGKSLAYIVPIVDRVLREKGTNRGRRRSSSTR